MRMSEPERMALTLRLLGTADQPGPLDSGWVVRTLAGTRQTLKRWRDRGIPPDRIDDVLEAVSEILPGTTEKEPPWVGRLEGRLIELRENQDRVAQSAATDVVTALAGPVREQWAARIAETLADIPTQSDEAPDDQPGTGAPGGATPTALEPS